MTLKRSALSLLLILAMIFAIPTAAGRNVNAYYSAGDIKNITIDSKGKIKWDAIPNAKSYQVNLTNGHLNSYTPEYDLYSFMNEHGYQSDTYEIKVLGYATDEGIYSGTTTYKYKSPYKELPAVKNLRISGGVLAWDFDYSAATGNTPGFDITVRGTDGSLNTCFTKKTSIPKSAFATTGKYDYTVSIQVQGQNYAYSDIVTKTFTGVTTTLPKITGISVSHNIITWDSLPGADSYHIELEYKPSEKKTVKPILSADTNHVSIGQYLTETDTNQSYDVKLKIWGEVQDFNKIRISEPTEYNLVYKYEEYPLKLYGDTVTSKMDITNLLGNGEVEYDPDENKLTFNNAKFEGASAHDYKTDQTMFATDGKLEVAGRAEITSHGTLFNVGDALSFDFSSNITAYTSYYTAVKAGYVSFRPGANITLTSEQHVLDVKNNIILLNNVAYVKLQTYAKEYYKAVNINKGRIVVPKTLSIVTPEGGKLSDDYKTIVDKNGKTATEIVIRPAAPTATPTPKPTATPTARPTSKPTAAPTAVPTSAVPTPTPGPNAMPTTEPTGAAAKPTGTTATSSPKPTTAPTGKVTTAPKPTTTGDATADANAQILAFVERIYTYVLDREPEAEGAAYWSDELYSFRRTGAEVAQGFIFSDEFINRNTTDEEFVTILYKTFFGRDPEEDGMNFWLEQLSTGAMDRVTVANGFIYSQEWADTCASYGIRSGGDLKPSGKIAPTELTYAFVERMYTTAMGRGYDEEGKQYWASELANFNITGEECGAAFFLSAEMEGYGLTDEEFLGRLYATFMNREADADGQAYWLDVMASGTSRADVVYGFTRSPEFTDKCVEARILPF